jgi:hypothetical protein
MTRGEVKRVHTYPFWDVKSKEQMKEHKISQERRCERWWDASTLLRIPEIEREKQRIKGTQIQCIFTSAVVIIRLKRFFCVCLFSFLDFLSGLLLSRKFQRQWYGYTWKNTHSAFWVDSCLLLSILHEFGFLYFFALKSLQGMRDTDTFIILCIHYCFSSCYSIIFTHLIHMCSSSRVFTTLFLSPFLYVSDKLVIILVWRKFFL